MQLRNLRYFVTVVHHGGFARATESAHASQPTLSKAVAQLEAEFGCRLLERGRQGVRLTQAGTIVHRHAQAMLSRTRQIQDELDALHDLQRGELRLGLPPLGSSILFAPLLAQYRKRYPQVDIHLREQGSQLLEQSLLTGDLDVVAILRPFGDGLASQPVCDEPMWALLPQSHPHAGADTFQLQWLNESPLILFEHGFALNRMIRELCAQRAITPRETLHSAQIEFILALVSSGGGIALLPRLTVRERKLSGTVALPLADPALRWQLDLAWRRDTQLSPAASAWLTLAATHRRQHD